MPAARDPLATILDEAVDQFGRAMWNKNNNRFRDRTSGLVFAISVITGLSQAVINHYLTYRVSAPSTSRNGQKMELWEWVNAQRAAQQKKEQSSQ